MLRRTELLPGGQRRSQEVRGEAQKSILREEQVSLFVPAVILVLAAEAFHLELHSTFLGSRQKPETQVLLTLVLVEKLLTLPTSEGPGCRATEHGRLSGN